MNRNLKIVVCSKNTAKNTAVENVIKDFFDNYSINSLDTNSKVSETPISDDEGILGCMNRINDAKQQLNDADLYIAMEGILSSCSNEAFLCGWTVIYDKASNEYMYGCSAKIHIPKEIISNLNKDERLSDVVAKYFKCTEDQVRNYGTNGILTNGCYTRTDEFTDSVLCAISTKYKKK